MTSIFKNIKNNLAVSKAADRLFRIPHDNYAERITAAEHVIQQLSTYTHEKQFFEEMLEKIRDEQDEANSSRRAS